MQWNILEISNNGLYLKLFRGFAVIMQDKQELGRVTLDELNSVIISADQATLSKSVIVRLAELGIPIIFCGDNYLPISLTLPLTNHHLSQDVLSMQIVASVPFKKRLWQRIVKLKINNQRSILEKQHPDKQTKLLQLKRLSQITKSGDPENTEAQAARLYWSELMGGDFRRLSNGGDDINGALNYGYAVVRAACARAVVAAGLNPSLGLHHKNKRNAFCLVDDLMEIYRPLIDHRVVNMSLNDGLTAQNKALLIAVLKSDIMVDDKVSTVNTSMQRLAVSLVECFRLNKPILRLPKIVE